MSRAAAASRRLACVRPGLVAALVAAALTAVALAAGCGDSEQDPNQVLERTFSGDQDVRQGTLSVTLTADPQGDQPAGAGGQPVPVRLVLPFTGPFEATTPGRLPKFELIGRLPAAPGAPSPNDRIALAADGSKAFVTVEGVTYEVPPAGFAALGRAYAQFSGARGEPNALGWLTDPKVEGEEELAGSDTIHVSAGVDLRRLLDDVGGSLDPGTRRQVEQTISNVRLDVWSLEDGNSLRRLKLAFDVAHRGRAVAGVPGGTIAILVDVSDVNDGQQVRPPASGEPFARLTRKLRAITGQAAQQPLPMPGQPAGAPRTPESTAPPPTGPAPLPPGVDPQKQRRYATCIGRAGTDLLAVQACARVLTE